MIEKFKYKKILNYSLLSIIGIFIIYYISVLTQHNMFWNDDYGYCAYGMNEGIFSSLNFQQEHGGGYIGLFLCKFLSFGLPNMCGIHPADFIGHIHGIILGFFTVFILLSITKFFTYYYKSTTAKLLILLLITLYFFVHAYSSWILLVNYNFYRYFFSLLFFSIFWNYIFKNILINCKKTNIPELILICFCGYVIGSSIEITIFTSTFLSILLVSYHLIEKLIKKQKINLSKKFYIPVTFLFSSAILFTTSNGFKEVASQRGMSNIHFNLQEFQEFCELYWQVCITNEFFYWILFFALMIGSFFYAIRKNEIKKAILPILLQFSIMTVMFSLYLCGKTGHNENFFLLHANVAFIYKMLLLYPLLMYTGYFLRNLSRQFNKKVILTILIIINITGIFNYIKENIKHITLEYKYKRDMVINIKKETYKMEKILRFYYLKDMIPYIPTYMRSIPNQGYAFSYVNIHDNPNCYNDQTTISYFPRIYKDTKSKQLGYCYCDNAIEKFYDAGGVFTEEELNNIEFQRLLDKDFVLNL